MPETIIHLCGISDNNISSELGVIINSCKCVFMSKRFKELYQQSWPSNGSFDVLPITPLDKTLDNIEKKLKLGNVAVLATGDPLFFGIGGKLIGRFGQDRVKVYPSLSVMQIAFSRFKLNWDDAIFFSLHGRKIDRLFSALMQGTKIFLFTDGKNSPDHIAEKIIGRLGNEKAMEYEGYIAENIGSENERLTKGLLRDIRQKSFSNLNVMIIRKRVEQKRKDIIFGLSEEEIQHSRGLITKNEIRAITLHQLRLVDQGIIWDIGAGSGSISIELARLFPNLSVYSIEKEFEQIENIKKNRQKFNCWNLNIIEGVAPEALSGLPDPDRIFVGGSGGNLLTILKATTMRLKSDGRLVVNCVLDKTFEMSANYLNSHGFRVSVSEVRVKRYQYPVYKKMNLNPIRIVAADLPYVAG